MDLVYLGALALLVAAMAALAVGCDRLLHRKDAP
jgi:hypothetical protein